MGRYSGDGEFLGWIALLSVLDYYNANLIFCYALPRYSSARADQNSQSGLFGRFRAFLGGVDLFSARNCCIANSLFDYAHSVKISARADQNSQSGLFGHFWAFLCAVDLFLPEIVTFPIYFLITHLLLKFQPKRTKLPKAAYLVVSGRFLVGLTFFCP